MKKDEEKPLTNKQRRFCEEYVIDCNGARAAIAAGYSHRTAKEQASQNLTKLNVKAYIEEIQKDLSKITGVTAIRNILELKKVAYTNVSDFKKNWTEFKDFDDLTEDEKAAISEFTHIHTEFEGGNKETYKIKMHDKLKAINMLNKMLGFDEPSLNEDDGTFKGTMILNIGSSTPNILPSEEKNIRDFTEDEPNNNNK